MPAQPTANQTLLFEQCVFELLQSSKVRKMDEYIQHGTTTTLTHSLAVAWYSYRLYLFLGLCGEEKQLIRGALLHDFYLYDWHWPDHGRLHGFFHPAIAAKNAAESFAITDLEREIIRKHMWPLTILPPCRRAAAIVCLVDKLCSLAEVARVPYGAFFFTLSQRVKLRCLRLREAGHLATPFC